jgi:hypothetical protein
MALLQGPIPEAAIAVDNVGTVLAAKGPVTPLVSSLPVTRSLIPQTPQLHFVFLLCALVYIFVLIS